MKQRSQVEPRRIYTSYEEFRAQFYETKDETLKEGEVGMIASFGKNLAKLVVEKAAKRD